ncbi:MAG: DNA polymerase domain-containing protein [Thermoplasmata archaeon]
MPAGEGAEPARGEGSFLLDAFPDHRTGRMVVWLARPGGARRLAFRYLPDFYIHGPPSDLERARRRFLDAGLYDCELTSRRIGIGSERLHKVLRVVPRVLGLHMRAARAADFFGGYGRLRFYNLDVELGQRFLLEQGLFPMARVRYRGGWELLDNRLSVHYPLPPLRVAWLRVRVRKSGLLPSFSDPLEAVELGGERISGGEEGALRELAALVRRMDPDVVLTDGGDSFDIPYLYHRARLAGLEGFQLGREPGPRRPERGEKSYFTYGRILHRPASYHLRGRLHIDRRSSFLYQEGGLEGVVELSRLSGIPLQRMARSSPGTAISAMEVNLVLSEGGLVAWKKNLPEDFKSMRTLLSADRGGFIFEPAVGLHGRVLEVDFASMYPHIMVLHNISPETVNCPCCRPPHDGDGEERVEGDRPGAGGDEPCRGAGGAWSGGGGRSEPPPEAGAGSAGGGEGEGARTGARAPGGRDELRQRAGTGGPGGAGGRGPPSGNAASDARMDAGEPGSRRRSGGSSRPPDARVDTGERGPHASGRAGGCGGLPVPGLGYWTCARRRGIIPRILEPLIRRRLELKALKRRPGDRWDRRARCLKPLLVTCFGYTGYRNAPFGRIECHEAINAHGREILLESARIAERRGFEVLHGIVDALWLRGPLDERAGLIDEISRASGIPLSEEGVYRWLVFLPSKGSGAGALNRYYGLFESGELKLRGVAARRHDSPSLVRALQAGMLEALAKGEDAAGFMRRIPDALDVVREFARRVLDGGCALEELVLTRRVSRDLEDYVQFNETRAALVALRSAGVSVPPGEAVRYVLVDGGGGRGEAVPVETLRGTESYHRGDYLRLLLRAAEELLLPFGYDAERLDRILRGRDTVQTALGAGAGPGPVC